LQGLQALSKLLSFVEVVRTPLERFEFRTDVQAIFDALLQNAATARIVMFLQLFDQPQLQVHQYHVIYQFQKTII